MRASFVKIERAEAMLGKLDRLHRLFAALRNLARDFCNRLKQHSTQ
jgi:hypothetical protein